MQFEKVEESNENIKTPYTIEEVKMKLNTILPTMGNSPQHLEFAIFYSLIVKIQELETKIEELSYNQKNQIQ